MNVIYYKCPHVTSSIGRHAILFNAQHLRVIVEYQHHGVAVYIYASLFVLEPESKIKVVRPLKCF